MPAKITVRSPLEDIEAANERAMDRIVAKLGEEWIVPDTTFDMPIFSDYIPGKRMLDIGCGSAKNASFFVEARLTYIGIDLSRKMLELARKNNPDLRFEKMSFRSLQFADKSFDGIWSCCALCHEPKRGVPAVLAEWRRVLGDKGIFYLVMPEHTLSVEDYHPDKWFEAFWRMPELEKTVAAAGFEILDIGRNEDAGTMYLMSRKK